MAEMKVQYVPIGQVKPYEKNPRKNKAAVDYVANSIKEFGWRQPIVTDKDFVIIVGHTRLQAAKKLKLKEVPVLVADDMTEEQAKAYRLADNKTAEFAEWDFDLLNDELLNLDMDMTLFGFDDDEEEEPQEIIEDEVPEAAESRCKLGDLWQLGEHRLICEDSTDPEIIDKLMGGEKAGILMIDPPYGIDAEKMTMGSGAKKFYRGDGWDEKRPPLDIALSLAPYSCVWGGNYFADILPLSNDWLVWWKKNDNLSFSECELAWTNFGTNVRHFAHHWGNEKKLHVTMKPVSVIAWAICLAKDKTGIVVDLFGGSGTTLIACEQLNRKCYMAELDPHYCDIILERWETFTGKKAERIE